MCSHNLWALLPRRVKRASVKQTPCHEGVSAAWLSPLNTWISSSIPDSQLAAALSVHLKFQMINSYMRFKNVFLPTKMYLQSLYTSEKKRFAFDVRHGTQSPLTGTKHAWADTDLSSSLTTRTWSVMSWEWTWTMLLRRGGCFGVSECKKGSARD